MAPTPENMLGMLNKSLWLAIHHVVLSAFVLGSIAIKAETLSVVSTVNLLGDLAETLGGSDIRSESLMGDGVDPHLYRATARDLSRLRKADLVLAVGLHLEGRMQEILEQLGTQGRAVILAGEKLPKEKLIEGDPHVWFDPELWKLVGDVVATALVERRASLKDGVQSRLATWKAEVDRVAAHGKTRLAQIPAHRRILITSHDAFRYFGRSFGIDVRGIQGTSTDSEASLKQMEELRLLIVKNKIPSIFVESSVSKIGIERLMETTGARLGGMLYSDSLGPRGSTAGTYLGTLRHNIDTVAEGLK